MLKSSVIEPFRFTKVNTGTVKIEESFLKTLKLAGKTNPISHPPKQTKHPLP